MINRGQAVLAALGNAPRGNVKVDAPDAKAKGVYGFTAQNPAFAPLADDLTKWANGDLSFLYGQMTTTGTPVKPDAGKRKRDAMADVLDGKGK
jgi:hypothetical protein